MKNIKFFIFKHKNLSLTNSFGLYKKYYDEDHLHIICNYVNGKRNGKK
jgi:antitoxin component YwqK of YwqJK toxin-antitoxin module